MTDARLRALDLLLALIALPIVIVLGLFIGLAIRLDSPGPALFRQTRVGRNGKPFTILKFRTMRVDAEKSKPKAVPKDIASFVFQSEADPRITRTGAFLRKTSLDELPQIFNVLAGQMSLVGPRPEVPWVVERYLEAYHRRHAVRPGITGLAQVSGRGELPLGETIAWDLEWVDRRSVRLYLSILLRTASSVWQQEGAR